MSSTASSYAECEGDNPRKYLTSLDMQNKVGMFAQGLFYPHQRGRNFLITSMYAGSRNVVYGLDFQDGRTIAAIVPLASHLSGSCACWHRDIAAKIRAEVLTINMISRNTSAIPIPRIHYFCATSINGLGHPYILQDYVNDDSASELWRSNGNPDSKEQSDKRQAFLTNLYSLVSQLNFFTSTKPGFPHFRNENIGKGQANPDGVESIGQYPFYVPRSQRHQDPYALSPPLLRDPNDHARRILLGRLSYPREPDDAPAREVLGASRYLRRVLHWTPVISPDETHDERPPYVLTHPDLDLPNIRVDGRGKITALLGWHGARYVPRCVGNDRLPLFLIEDCLAGRYHYKEVPRLLGKPKIVNPQRQDALDVCRMWRKRWFAVIVKYFGESGDQRDMDQGRRSRRMARNSRVLQLYEFVAWARDSEIVDIATGILRRTIEDSATKRNEWVIPGNRSLTATETVFGYLKDLTPSRVFKDLAAAAADGENEVTRQQMSLLENMYKDSMGIRQEHLERKGSGNHHHRRHSNNKPRRSRTHRDGDRGRDRDRDRHARFWDEQDGPKLARSETLGAQPRRHREESPIKQRPATREGLDTSSTRAHASGWGGFGDDRDDFFKNDDDDDDDDDDEWNQYRPRTVYDPER